MKRTRSPGFDLREPLGRNGDGGVGFGRRVLGLGAGSEPDARRRNDAAEVIALGTIFQHGRAVLDGAGAQLGACEIHGDLAGAAGFLRCAAKVAHHSGPCLGAVVGAVDAHAIHAMKNEIADEVIVSGGFRGHGHHNANVAAGRRGTEQDFRILFEQGGAFADCGRAVGRIEGCLGGASELIE